MADHDDDMDEDNGTAATDKPKKVYIPGKSRQLKPGETWEFDKNVYRMFRQFATKSPCLSFDTIVDDEGPMRETYPLNAYLVCGTQAERARDNEIVVIKLERLARMKHDSDNEDSSSSSDSENDSDDDNVDDDGQNRDKNNGHIGGKKTAVAKAVNPLAPAFHSATIAHHGGVNRIRSSRLSPTSCVCAVWNDTGKVQIWNLSQSLTLLNDTNITPPVGGRRIDVKNEKPLHTFDGHAGEGFALDWSMGKIGDLLSGDTRGRIYAWTLADGGVWRIAQRPYTGHDGSVEDVQWSPNETTVFASVSSDQSLRLWDTRVTPAQANVCTVTQAHTNDINVCSWNTLDPMLLVTGGDDKCLRIWDIRQLSSIPALTPGHTYAMATFTHHTDAITSVHWSPHESTVFAASGDDHQTSIWDIAVERDEETDKGHNPPPVTGEQTTIDENDIPPQLLFTHMGQKYVKEVRWHPQLVGTLITTSQDGFDVFRTICV